MHRTLLLTDSDLAEANGALEAIDTADQAIRDLRERCLTKEDEVRSGRLRVAISRLGEAREIVKASFR